ncbi:hypothetical protein [uncultured Hymenobacter sp.]|uniref:hypothetical protein n=1 Tax=uncultured Hymenobacter sp. TaxID=170016 RepID=UPI0035CA1812
MLISIAVYDIKVLLLLVGLTGLFFIWGRISDSYDNRPIKSQKPIIKNTSGSSNEVSNTIKLIISVAGLIIIVALAATAMLVARALLFIAALIGGVFALVFVIRNWMR